VRFKVTILQRITIEGLLLAFILYQINAYYSSMKALLILLQLIIPNGKNVSERFKLPEGYQRHKSESNSFGEFLQTFPLKNTNSKVYYTF
jgi:hypothetical protein